LHLNGGVLVYDDVYNVSYLLQSEHLKHLVWSFLSFEIV